MAKENEVILSNQNIISQNTCFEYILWMSYVNDSVCMSVCIMPVHVSVSHLMLAWESEMHRKHFFKVSPEMLREWKTKWNYFPDVYSFFGNKQKQQVSFTQTCTSNFFSYPKQNDIVWERIGLQILTHVQIWTLKYFLIQWLYVNYILSNTVIDLPLV